MPDFSRVLQAVLIRDSLNTTSLNSQEDTLQESLDAWFLAISLGANARLDVRASVVFRRRAHDKLAFLIVHC
jgi:hypothetical protein